MKTGDLLFQVDPRPYQTALEQAARETPPRGIERGPGEGAGERQSGAGRAGPRLGGAGGGQRHQGGGDPEAVRARRRPLHARGRARVREPAGAGQRGADQPREPGRRRGRARRAPELAGQRGAGGGGAREGARRRRDAAGGGRRGPRRPGGRPAEPRLHPGHLAHRRHRRVPRREHRRPRRPERQPAADHRVAGRSHLCRGGDQRAARLLRVPAMGRRSCCAPPARAGADPGRRQRLPEARTERTSSTGRWT